MGRKLFTSESVTEGHPDKMCDQISDAILDAFLRDDPESRVACEVAATTGMIFIFGEISSNAVVDCAKIARDVVRRIGYTSSEMGFDADTCSVVTSIGKQSCNIAQGVDHSSDSGEIGAGDQGMVFGYACNETPELMPLSISLAHKLAQKLAEVRKNGEIVGLRPDGKTQVTIEYDEDKPIKVDTVIVSAQHDLEFDMAKLKKMIFEKVVIPTIPFEYYRNGLKLYVNPTGCFEIGGPHGDSGLTGRKIIVDTYGGHSKHGGGAFSGKDPTKVDRSAAYMARYIAKNIVAAELAKKCEIQISYAIGMSKPVSIYVDTFGTSEYTNDLIKNIIEKVFDLRPSAIVDTLVLKRPIYENIACYGHMGRSDVDLSWEKTDKVDEIHCALRNIIGTGIERTMNNVAL
jgi:S-adenosylmethionine synthetase